MIIRVRTNEDGCLIIREKLTIIWRDQNELLQNMIIGTKW